MKRSIEEVVFGNTRRDPQKNNDFFKAGIQDTLRKRGYGRWSKRVLYWKLLSYETNRTKV